jgi:acyl dehydratase
LSDEAKKAKTYEWDVAKIGDTNQPATIPIEPERIKEYIEAEQDFNPLYTDEAYARENGFDGPAVPIPMYIVYAAQRRHELMHDQGYEHPLRPTPFSRFVFNSFAPVKVGDSIRSQLVLHDKYEKNGRRYLVWHNVSYNQNGEKVLEYYYTNMWDGSKPEDRLR